MHNIKDYMTTVEAMCNILAKDNLNQTAQQIRMLAGEALVKAGYPHANTETGYMLEVGAYVFIVDMETAIQERMERDGAAGSNARIRELETENAKLRDEIKTIKKHIRSVFETYQAPEVETEVERATADTEPVRVPEVAPMKEKEMGQVKDIEEDDSADDTVPLKRTQVQNRGPSQAAKKQTPSPTRPEIVMDHEPAAAKGKKAAPAAPMNTETYRESLHKTEFALSYQQIRIEQQGSGAVSTCEIIASPMQMKEGEVDIMVWCGETVKTETRISQGGRPSVLMQVGSTPLIVTGYVKEGTFHTRIETTKSMQDKGVSVSSSEKVYGGKGHVLLQDDGVAIHVMPVSLENRQSGSAEFCYAVISRDEEPIIGENGPRDAVTFTYHGKLFELRCKWKDDTLYSAARPVSEG